MYKPLRYGLEAGLVGLTLVSPPIGLAIYGLRVPNLRETMCALGLIVGITTTTIINNYKLPNDKVIYSQNEVFINEKHRHGLDRFFLTSIKSTTHFDAEVRSIGYRCRFDKKQEDWQKSIQSHLNDILSNPKPKI